MDESVPVPRSDAPDREAVVSSNVAGFGVPGEAEGSFARTNARREGQFALAAAVGYLLLFRLTSLLPFNEVLILLATLLSLVLVLVFTVRTARALQTPKAIAWALFGFGLLGLPRVLLPIGAAVFPALQNIALPLLRAYSWLGIVPGLRGLMLIGFAASLGALLARLVKETKILLPMAVALACVDLYVVFGGGLVTQAQNTHHPNKVAQVAMNALTVSLPTTQTKAGAAPLQLSVGFADFLFIALFFACFARFDIPARRTFQVLCALLAAYMLVVYYGNLALPALVPIAIVVIGMNLRQFRYDRSEAFALLYAGLIVAAVLGGLFVLNRRSAGPAKPTSTRSAPTQPVVPKPASG